METHLPARNELPIRNARHLDLPQVRRPPAMDGPALAAQLSRAMRPEEVRRVRDPENALLPERQRAVPGAVAGDRLHDRTVDAAVEHAVGLVVLRTGHEPRAHAFGRHLEHLEPERSAPRIGLRNPIVRHGSPPARNSSEATHEPRPSEYPGSMPVCEVLPGVFHWTAVHPEIKVHVHCHYLEAPRALLDPLVPEEGLAWFERRGSPRHILLTNRLHS